MAQTRGIQDPHDKSGSDKNVAKKNALSLPKDEAFQNLGSLKKASPSQLTHASQVLNTEDTPSRLTTEDTRIPSTTYTKPYIKSSWQTFLPQLQADIQSLHDNNKPVQVYPFMARLDSSFPGISALKKPIGGITVGLKSPALNQVKRIANFITDNKGIQPAPKKTWERFLKTIMVDHNDNFDPNMSLEHALSLYKTFSQDATSAQQRNYTKALYSVLNALTVEQPSTPTIQVVHPDTDSVQTSSPQSISRSSTPIYEDETPEFMQPLHSIALAKSWKKDTYKKFSRRSTPLKKLDKQIDAFSRQSFDTAAQTATYLGQLEKALKTVQNKNPKLRAESVKDLLRQVQEDIQNIEPVKTHQESSFTDQIEHSIHTQNWGQLKHLATDNPDQVLSHINAQFSQQKLTVLTLLQLKDVLPTLKSGINKTLRTHSEQCISLAIDLFTPNLSNDKQTLLLEWLGSNTNSVSKQPAATLTRFSRTLMESWESEPKNQLILTCIKGLLTTNSGLSSLPKKIDPFSPAHQNAQKIIGETNVYRSGLLAFLSELPKTDRAYSTKSLSIIHETLKETNDFHQDIQETTLSAIGHIFTSFSADNTAQYTDFLFAGLTQFLDICPDAIHWEDLLVHTQELPDTHQKLTLLRDFQALKDTCHTLSLESEQNRNEKIESLLQEKHQALYDTLNALDTQNTLINPILFKDRLQSIRTLLLSFSSKSSKSAPLALSLITLIHKKILESSWDSHDIQSLRASKGDFVRFVQHTTIKTHDGQILFSPNDTPADLLLKPLQYLAPDQFQALSDELKQTLGPITTDTIPKALDYIQESLPKNSPMIIYLKSLNQAIAEGCSEPHQLDLSTLLSEDNIMIKPLQKLVDGRSLTITLSKTHVHHHAKIKFTFLDGNQVQKEDGRPNVIADIAIKSDITLALSEGETPESNSTLSLFQDKGMNKARSATTCQKIQTYMDQLSGIYRTPASEIERLSSLSQTSESEDVKDILSYLSGDIKGLFTTHYSQTKDALSNLKTVFKNTSNQLQVLEFMDKLLSESQPENRDITTVFSLTKSCLSLLIDAHLTGSHKASQKASRILKAHINRLLTRPKDLQQHEYQEIYALIKTGISTNNSIPIASSFIDRLTELKQLFSNDVDTSDLLNLPLTSAKSVSSVIKQQLQSLASLEAINHSLENVSKSLQKKWIKNKIDKAVISYLNDHQQTLYLSSTIDTSYYHDRFGKLNELQEQLSNVSSRYKKNKAFQTLVQSIDTALSFYPIGKRQDKTVSGQKFSSVVSSSHQEWELLNTIDKEIAKEVFQQTGVDLRQKANKVILGEGAAGKVRLARNKLTGKLVAVKKLKLYNPDKDTFSNTLEDLQNELSLQMESQQFNNVVPVLDYSLVEGKNSAHKCYIFTPLFSGDLTTLEGCKNDDLALSISQKLTQTISDLHQQDIYHCDIKPQNILVDSKQDVALMDFGIASQSKHKLNLERTILFTSPEQLDVSSTSIDNEKNDAWALGVTLYALYTGKKPYNLDQPVDSIHLHKHIQKEPLDLSLIQNPTLKKLIQGLLEKDPAKRLTPTTALSQIPELKQLAPLNPTIQETKQVLGAQRNEIKSLYTQKQQQHRHFLSTQLTHYDQLLDAIESNTPIDAALSCCRTQNTQARDAFEVLDREQFERQKACVSKTLGILNDTDKNDALAFLKGSLDTTLTQLFCSDEMSTNKNEVLENTLTQLKACILKRANTTDAKTLKKAPSIAFLKQQLNKAKAQLNHLSDPQLLSAKEMRDELSKTDELFSWGKDYVSLALSEPENWTTIRTLSYKKAADQTRHVFVTELEPLHTENGGVPSGLRGTEGFKDKTTNFHRCTHYLLGTEDSRVISYRGGQLPTVSAAKQALVTMMAETSTSHIHISALLTPAIGKNLEQVVGNIRGVAGDRKMLQTHKNNIMVALEELRTLFSKPRLTEEEQFLKTRLMGAGYTESNIQMLQNDIMISNIGVNEGAVGELGAANIKVRGGWHTSIKHYTNEAVTRLKSSLQSSLSILEGDINPDTLNGVSSDCDQLGAIVQLGLTLDKIWAQNDFARSQTEQDTNQFKFAAYWKALDFRTNTTSYVNCMSGKDRTGEVETNAYAIHDEIELSIALHKQTLTKYLETLIAQKPDLSSRLTPYLNSLTSACLTVEELDTLITSTTDDNFSTTLSALLTKKVQAAKTALSAIIREKSTGGTGPKLPTLSGIETQRPILDSDEGTSAFHAFPRVTPLTPYEKKTAPINDLKAPSLEIFQQLETQNRLKANQRQSVLSTGSLAITKRNTSKIGFKFHDRKVLAENLSGFDRSYVSYVVLDLLNRNIHPGIIVQQFKQLTGLNEVSLDTQHTITKKLSKFLDSSTPTDKILSKKLQVFFETIEKEKWLATAPMAKVKA
ncbi:hypothetical protein DID77_01140 [Candidatus Marinamargulisbacteria bacterium SCGC AG-439-L15]|nr:hypothetical protein DID77_01140 [Candidatus Marinamargulisbacteria bacterium SCGC AG-439-L15]